MGTEIKIEFTGLAEMIQGMRDIPDAVAMEVRKAEEQDLRDVASILGDYPPQKPGTHYIRTGDLGYGWLESMPKFSNYAGLNFDVGIENPVKYSGDVQGSPGQLDEFKRRDWKTTDQALAETEDRAQKRLEEAVQRGLDKTVGK